ncbi:unnamed protein product [Darwinula stevensoni]|uniref:non-specific serine/threonine protein kinase n=1 Tax=Darwinula stevensoni TaxID=69355 RepID=A0A7R8X3B1_9CRUS|nr:unnamed protein product [Darwinula stevensoni]CAG0884197.1 unnamed protein product [Darwinula stevensoni]
MSAKRGKAVVRKAAKGYNLPPPLPSTQILCDSTKTRWRLGKSIGTGGFGEIYLASFDVNKPVGSDAPFVVKIEPHGNGPLFTEIHCYRRILLLDKIEDWKKTRKLKFLGVPHIVGSGSHEYKGVMYRFMVMQRYGQDVHKMFEMCGHRFPLKTVFNLGIKVLDILEYIHANNYVHYDVKGLNLLLGFGNGHENEVYLVDYGLAMRYKEEGRLLKDDRPDKRYAHNGTIEYVSRDAHLGVFSPRGDLETLGYNILRWASGILPWEENLTDVEYVQTQKTGFMANIPSLMKACFPQGSPPNAIAKYLEYVCSLSFHTTPDYEHCRKILRQGLKVMGAKDDGILEWKPAETRKATRRPSSGTGSDEENLEVKAKRRRKNIGNPLQSVRNVRSASSGESSSSTEEQDDSLPTHSKEKSKKHVAKDNRIHHDGLNLNSLKGEILTPAMEAILNSRQKKASKGKKAGSVFLDAPPVADPDYGTILTPAMELVKEKRLERLSSGSEQSFPEEDRKKLRQGTHAKRQKKVGSACASASTQMSPPEPPKPNTRSRKRVSSPDLFE